LNPPDANVVIPVSQTAVNAVTPASQQFVNAEIRVKLKLKYFFSAFFFI